MIDWWLVDWWLNNYDRLIIDDGWLIIDWWLILIIDVWLIDDLLMIY